MQYCGISTICFGIYSNQILLYGILTSNKGVQKMIVLQFVFEQLMEIAKRSLTQTSYKSAFQPDVRKLKLKSQTGNK